MSNKKSNNKYKNSQKGKGGAAQSKARVWIIGVAVALVVIIAISFGIAFGGSAKKGKQNAAGDLVIPLSQITKNVKNLYRYGGRQKNGSNCRAHFGRRYPYGV